MLAYFGNKLTAARIPDHVSYAEAAMLEPLSVGIHACRRAGISVGQTVLITGAGPIGLMALLSARSFGATTIIVSDINAHRLSVAKDLGAHFVHNACSEGELKDLVSDGSIPIPDATIECSGAQSAITAAIRVSPRERPLRTCLTLHIVHEQRRRGRACWLGGSDG